MTAASADDIINRATPSAKRQAARAQNHVPRVMIQWKRSVAIGLKGGGASEGSGVSCLEGDAEPRFIFLGGREEVASYCSQLDDVSPIVPVAVANTLLAAVTVVFGSFIVLSLMLCESLGISSSTKYIV